MMADLDLFPENYEEARRRFKILTERMAGPKTGESWPVPSALSKNLTVDTVYLPPAETPEKLFVIISGVHGLEAYAGHAIQSMILQEFLPRADRRRTGFFFIHALNPFGFQNHRRGTESGVNLNRNCSVDPRLYLTKNPESIALSDRFVPRVPVDSLKCFLLRQMRKDGEKIFFGDVSLDQFIKGSGLGQFESAAGLEYGGRGPEPQVQKLIEALKDMLPDYEDIVLLDLHTGLGERARLHLLAGDLPGCVSPELFNTLFRPQEDRAVYDFTPADSEGFYQTFGATNNIFPELARPGQRLCAMTMEFGTLGHTLENQLDSLNQWLLEHQGSLYGYASPELEQKIRAGYLEKFFPSDPAWRKQVIATSRDFLDLVFKRSDILL